MSTYLLALLPVYLPVVTCLLGMSCGCLRVMSAVHGGPNCTLEICSENSIGYLHLSPDSDSIVHIRLSLCEINALSSRNKLFCWVLFTCLTTLSSRINASTYRPIMWFIFYLSPCAWVGVGDGMKVQHLRLHDSKLLILLGCILNKLGL